MKLLFILISIYFLSSCGLPEITDNDYPIFDDLQIKQNSEQGVTLASFIIDSGNINWDRTAINFYSPGKSKNLISENLMTDFNIRDTKSDISFNPNFLDADSIACRIILQRQNEQLVSDTIQFRNKNIGKKPIQTIEFSNDNIFTLNGDLYSISSQQLLQFSFNNNEWSNLGPKEEVVSKYFGERYQTEEAILSIINIRIGERKWESVLWRMNNIEEGFIKIKEFEFYEPNTGIRFMKNEVCYYSTSEGIYSFNAETPDIITYEAPIHESLNEIKIIKTFVDNDRAVIIGYNRLEKYPKIIIYNFIDKTWDVGSDYTGPNIGEITAIYDNQDYIYMCFSKDDESIWRYSLSMSTWEFLGWSRNIDKLEHNDYLHSQGNLIHLFGKNSITTIDTDLL